MQQDSAFIVRREMKAGGPKRGHHWYVNGHMGTRSSGGGLREGRGVTGSPSGELRRSWRRRAEMSLQRCCRGAETRAERAKRRLSEEEDARGLKNQVP